MWIFGINLEKKITVLGDNTNAISIVRHPNRRFSQKIQIHSDVDKKSHNNNFAKVEYCEQLNAVHCINIFILKLIKWTIEVGTYGFSKWEYYTSTVLYSTLVEFNEYTI